MSEDTDAEDTISVPLPEVKADPGPEAGPQLSEEEREKFERTVADMAEVKAALATMERTLNVAMIAFENLKTLISGDGESVVHAWPTPEAEVMPCCGKKMMDAPLTERISIDGTGVTCGKVSV